jgi:hypothetical protein
VLHHLPSTPSSNTTHPLSSQAPDAAEDNHLDLAERGEAPAQNHETAATSQQNRMLYAVIAVVVFALALKALEIISRLFIPH